MSNNAALLEKIINIEEDIEKTLYTLCSGGIMRRNTRVGLDRKLAHLREEMDEVIRAYEIECLHCGVDHQVRVWKMFRGTESGGDIVISCPGCHVSWNLDRSQNVKEIIDQAYALPKDLFA